MGGEGVIKNNLVLKISKNQIRLRKSLRYIEGYFVWIEYIS